MSEERRWAMHSESGNQKQRRKRSRKAATVAPAILRTCAEVCRVWPRAEAILPSRMIEVLATKDKRHLLTMLACNRILAYQCLRWARWMGHDRRLHVSCVRCHGKAWSDSVVSQQMGKGYCRIDEGKWRWVCPGPPAGRRTCRRYFYDTSGTPFLYSRVSPGLVLAALAYPSGVIQRLLEECGQYDDLRWVQRVLTGLAHKQHRQLACRLRGYARLFCGNVFLAHCARLTRGFSGRPNLNRRIRSEQARQAVAAESDVQSMRHMRKKYRAVRHVLRELKELDARQIRQSDRITERSRLWIQLQTTIQDLSDPVRARTVSLEELLAEIPPVAAKRRRSGIRLTSAARWILASQACFEDGVMYSVH